MYCKVTLSLKLKLANFHNSLGTKSKLFLFSWKIIYFFAKPVFRAISSSSKNKLPLRTKNIILFEWKIVICSILDQVRADRFGLQLYSFGTLSGFFIIFMKTYKSIQKCICLKETWQIKDQYKFEQLLF